MANITRASPPVSAVVDRVLLCALSGGLPCARRLSLRALGLLGRRRAVCASRVKHRFCFPSLDWQRPLALLLLPGAGGPQVSPRSGCAASGHQGGEHPHDEERPCEAGRFRCGHEALGQASLRGGRGESIRVFPSLGASSFFFFFSFFLDWLYGSYSIGASFPLSLDEAVY